MQNSEMCIRDSYNIIEASLEALADAVTYKLYKTEQARWRA